MKNSQDLLDVSDLKSQLRTDLQNKIADNHDFASFLPNYLLFAEDNKCSSHLWNGEEAECYNMQKKLIENLITLGNDVLREDAYLTQNISKHMLASITFILFDRLAEQVKQQGYGDEAFNFCSKLATLTKLELGISLDSLKNLFCKTSLEEKSELQPDQFTDAQEVKTNHNEGQDEHHDIPALGQ